MHPLTPDLTQLNDADLQQKFRDLQNKLTMAWRMGAGEAVQQMQMLLEDYQSEINERNRKSMEELMSKNEKYKDIIDIK